MTRTSAKRRAGRRLLTLAAVIALAAALSGLAVAVNFLGLRDALLPRQGRVNAVDENGVMVPGEYEYTDFISLSGYSDTPESRALAEWNAFLEDYDPDGAIVQSIGNDPTGFEEDYGLYLVYTQEMADKLDAITEAYHLKLHSWMEVVLPDAWPIAVGDFLKENNSAWSGYIYEDGTFRYDGEAELPGYGTIDYQFSRSVRGSFNDVALNIGDLSDFQEWGYQTSGGGLVTLGLGSRNRSLIMADLGDSFLLVNVLTGAEGDDTFSSGGIGRAELEALADSFDLSVLSPVETPDRDAILAANESYMEILNSPPLDVPPEEAPDKLYSQSGISADIAQDFVHLLSEKLEEDRREEIADLFAYPVQIETADGSVTAGSPEALLAHYDETIAQNRLGLSADLAWNAAPTDIFSDGSGLLSAADGAVWFDLVEDGVIRIFTMQTDQWSIRPAAGTETGQR